MDLEKYLGTKEYSKNEMKKMSIGIEIVFSSWIQTKEWPNVTAIICDTK